MKIIVLVLIAFTMIGCTESLKDSVRNTNQIGETDIRYYADKTVSSLEVPPDLTKPRINDTLRIDDIVDTSNTIISFDSPNNKPIKAIHNKDINIDVRKNAHQSYLVIDKSSDYVLEVAKEFLQENGFSILKENKVIGILETNFLENRPDVPEKNLNFLRSMLKSAVGASYALPTLDKYRVRVETVGNHSELYLSLSSMQEVVTNKGADNENTIWQEKARDEFLETEMLYRLMVYMGTDNTTAKQEIIQASNNNTISVELKTDVSGFAKLQIDASKEKAWELISFALDSLAITIEDQDKPDGSFYIKTVNDEERGVMSSIFGDEAINQNFRIRIKELSPGFTEVYFMDLSEENTDSTKRFSHTFFSRLKESL